LRAYIRAIQQTGGAIMEKREQTALIASILLTQRSDKKQRFGKRDIETAVRRAMAIQDVVSQEYALFQESKTVQIKAVSPADIPKKNPGP
jgi:hypothetical protein